MQKFPCENLYFLELLVNDIYLYHCEMSKETKDAKGELCVAFQFLDKDPITICESDIQAPETDPCDPCRGSKAKNGKSCLFALTERQANKACIDFDIKLTIYKNNNGKKTDIGCSEIPVNVQFNDLLYELSKIANNDEDVDEESNPARTVKGAYAIKDVCDVSIGYITVFLRLSGFGKTIITQFQMDLCEKSVAFKDKEGTSTYRYKSQNGVGALNEENGRNGKGGPCEKPCCPTCKDSERQGGARSSGPGNVRVSFNCPPSGSAGGFYPNNFHSQNCMSYSQSGASSQNFAYHGRPSNQSPCPCNNSNSNNQSSPEKRDSEADGKSEKKPGKKKKDKKGMKEKKGKKEKKEKKDKKGKKEKNGKMPKGKNSKPTTDDSDVEEPSPDPSKTLVQNIPVCPPCCAAVSSTRSFAQNPPAQLYPTPSYPSYPSYPPRPSYSSYPTYPPYFQNHPPSTPQLTPVPCQVCPEPTPMERSGNKPGDRYQEIGVEMNGNKMIMRIHKDPKKKWDTQTENGDGSNQDVQVIKPISSSCRC